MNGTRKGRLKLTPNVRYALSEGDSLILADIPCQYVSCSARSASSQADTKTPGSRNSRIKTVSPGALGVADRVGTKCVNGGMEVKESSIRGSCLSFEQTPRQPQGSLVPDSDSDSDSERGGRGGRRQKTQGVFKLGFYHLSVKGKRQAQILFVCLSFHKISHEP